MVDEVRELRRLGELDALRLEVEDVRKALELVLVGLLEVDPEDGRAAQPREGPFPVDLGDLAVLAAATALLTVAAAILVRRRDLRG